MRILSNNTLYKTTHLIQISSNYRQHYLAIYRNTCGSSWLKYIDAPANQVCVANELDNSTYSAGSAKSKKMRSRRQFSGLILILINLISQINAQSNEVIGCGGFIKSHADIDFSKVEIKLYVMTFINESINHW